MSEAFTCIVAENPTCSQNPLDTMGPWSYIAWNLTLSAPANRASFDAPIVAFCSAVLLDLMDSRAWAELVSFWVIFLMQSCSHEVCSMGVTLEVTMGVHISVGTWGSPDQSMAGQWLPLSKMVPRKIRFSLCEVINRQGVFLWAHKRHVKFHCDPLCFGRPGFQKLITLSHRIKN